MPKKFFDFAKSFAELEAITRWFDTSESRDLEKGLTQFERGLELAAILKAKLSEAENKIIEIKNKFPSVIS